MKRFLFNSLLILTFSNSVCFANALTCAPTYEGKPFVQATIWSDVSGFGPAECDYKNPGDIELTVYHLPKNAEYYVVSGHWRSTMPGYQWCAISDGGTYDSCKFALRVTD